MRPIALLALVLAAGGASAKLPALSDEAKAKAAETTARTAWSDKVAAYQLCQSMDRVAAAYLERARAEGKAAQPTPTPPCSDPGAFNYVPPESKPLEAAGAHSPPQTAATPHNTTQPAAAGSKP
ncbi:hypothetical protein [Pseudorhodoferax soli]|jgi:hypothetical protein|uniref:Uncharacterized protein n=1 Tax=Pseudorhodoferax soli TaxID=545864 RepID=A0A368XHH6_9BURK|nr:hypothetical protein [Pseudorhodoferax soli]RCW67450.1 hypothetical protein DES41_109173 [Pseudorhodoferax soli]